MIRQGRARPPLRRPSRSARRARLDRAPIATGGPDGCSHLAEGVGRIFRDTITAVKLPTLPGRLNAPLPTVLLLFVATPLLTCCCIGTIATASSDNEPGSSQTPNPSVEPTASTTTSAPPTSAVPPTSTAPPADVYYASCDEARAAGAAPIYRGQPGYRRALDRDNDGVACE